MAKSRTREFRSFGPLTHRGGTLWGRPIDVEFFGESCSIPLLVNIAKHTGEPESNEVEAYGTFDKDVAGFLKLAEAAGLEAFRSARSLEEKPTNSQAAGHVRLAGVMFPYVRNRPTFGFLLDCDWNEDGLAVKFECGHLIGIVPQDEVL